MNALARSQHIRLWIAVLAVGVSLVVCGCSPNARGRDDDRFRALLAEDYPGFKVERLRYLTNGSSWVGSDAGPMATYDFTLDSEDAPGFRLVGMYYLERLGGQQGWAPRGSMFDGRPIPRSQLIELQRLWLSVAPATVIEVGDDSATGSMANERRQDFLQRIAPKYRDIPLGQLYHLYGAAASDGRIRRSYYFRLSPDGRWTYLPDFFARK